MIHYVATHLGFVRDARPFVDQISDIQPRIRLTRNVRLAYPFSSWVEADNFGRRYYSREYYAILAPVSGEVEYKQQPQVKPRLLTRILGG